MLGLEPGAKKTDVNSAYRKLSRKVHPDQYKGDNPEWATEQFLRLTRAKEVLLDDKARAAYEAVGDRAGVGRACEGLGVCHNNMGQPARALPWYVQARGEYEAVGDGAGVARVCACLSNRRRRATAQGWRGCAGACPTF